jgi:glycosyltransferase involved in cell wall biosynthesis
MNILMLTPYLPYPATDGGQIRSLNLIKHLSKKHDITLFSYIRYRDRNQEDDIKVLKKYCKKVEVVNRGKTWTLGNILRTGFSPYPFLISIYRSPELREKIRIELTKGHYDLIHAETFYVMPYIPTTDIPVILVEQTINYRVFEHYVKTNKWFFLRPLLWIDVQKLKYWETYYWKKATKVTAVSDADANIMKAHVPGLSVQIVANAIGQDFENLPANLHYNHDILFMGNYKWMQNWEAAEVLIKYVFPRIKEKIHDCRLIIAGQFVRDSIKKYAAKDIVIRELRPDDGAGVARSMTSAGVLVAPIYGPGGTRLKILGATAAMLPVVSTQIAAEGLSFEHRDSIMIGNTTEELAACAVGLLQDKKLYEKIAMNAKKIVEKNYTWGSIAKKLEGVYRDVAGKKV